MADWAPLRELLATVELGDEVTLTWDELDKLVGGMPPSARNHPAFWSGKRPSWAGFRTHSVRLGDSVTFVRVKKVVTSISEAEQSSSEADASLARLGELQERLSTMQIALNAMDLRLQAVEAAV